ncbi:hypothetical protein FG386_000617 [Cryptosporidium ryanae]|uniref:uncharacterized protein n=1 Tax=Cryptosporidium ryanae TaxID=515981 RepID=UPI00351A0E4B|nr:hypothetical protein FG386_000617 [Cryptosporidium ryanae]
MFETCSRCEKYVDEVNKLKCEVYNLSRANIKSQKTIQDKYEKKINELLTNKSELEKTVKEYQEYKSNSEQYYKEVNNTLLIAKSKLKELQDRILFLETTNSELNNKFKEAQSILNILLEKENMISIINRNKL